VKFSTFHQVPQIFFRPFAAAEIRAARCGRARLHTFSFLFLPCRFPEAFALDIRQIIPYNAPKTTQGGNGNAYCYLR
jgi:hypothetical protein